MFKKRSYYNNVRKAAAGGAGAIADEAQDDGDENAQNAGNVNFLMQHCYGQLEEEKPNKKKRRNSGTARPSSAAILDAIRREEVADHLGVAVQNPMLGAAELAAAAQRTANFSDFEWNKNHIVDYLYELTPRGSAQHDLGVRKMAVRLVLWNVLEQFDDSEHEIDDDDTKHGISLVKSILAIAKFVHIGSKQLSSWMRELFDSGEITGPKRKGERAIITTYGQVSRAMMMEMMAFNRHRHGDGLATNFNAMSEHLRSDVRYDAVVLLYPESCPPMIVNPRVLRKARRGPRGSSRPETAKTPRRATTWSSTAGAASMATTRWSRTRVGRTRVIPAAIQTTIRRERVDG